MDKNELVVLIYNAYDNYASVEATYKYIFNSHILALAREKSINKEQGGKLVKHRSKTIISQTEEDLNNIKEYIWRVWYQKPSKWRVEKTKKECNDKFLNIINGKHWWIYTSEGELLTNLSPKNRLLTKISINKTSPEPSKSNIKHAIRDTFFLNPSYLLATHGFEILGITKHVEREAIHVLAIPRIGLNEDIGWFATEELDLLFDKERGIILRCSVNFDGQEYAALIADSIVFDRIIPDDVFFLDPKKQKFLKKIRIFY